MEDDKILIARYLGGDGSAVEELVVKYQKLIYAYVYRITNDMEDAKDLTQETFIRAINGLGRFRMEASFKNWLYKIALNTSLDHLRKKKHKEIELDESTAINQKEIPASIIEREERNNVRKGLDELPERQRLALTLRVYEGLSCKETAKIMGCSEGTVKTHYHFAVKKLREVLRIKGYEIKS